MAFSMFLHKSACSNRAFSQQVMRLATQTLTAHGGASTLPVRSLTLENNPNTPLATAVRSFRTSAGPCLSARMPHDEKAHDHSKLWVVEKLTSAALVPLIPLALAMPSKILDAVVAILITAHTFWGLDAIVVEYVRTILFGSLVPKLATAVVYACTAVMLGGLYYLIFNDIGMARAFWRIWHNMRKPKCRPKVKKGLEAIAVDYVRATIFGPLIPKIALGLVYALSIATLGGLFYVISHDIGIANTFRALWAVKSEQNA